MKITRYEARSGAAVARALKLSALGVLTISAATLIACGDANPTSSTPHIGNSSGGSSGSTSSSAGNTSSAAGTLGSGAAAGTGGSTGIAGDTSVAGSTTSVAGSTGTAGTDSGTAGAGGTTPVTYPFCSPMATPVVPRTPLPFAVTTAYYPSGYEGGDPGMNGGGQIAAGACTDRSPTQIGTCAKYTWTPAATPTWAGVAYIRGYNGFGSNGHAPVCLADGATAITFYAKGAVGGEVVGFSGGTAMSQDFTLTADWKLYTIPISGLPYNTDASGLEDGFFWKIAPAAGSTPVAETFYVDSIQYVGAQGGGGTGGAGGTSSGGAGGAATAGAGGAAAGSGGAATSGAGGAAAGSGGAGGAH